MSRPATAAILQSMMEDLGLGRVEELPMEDNPSFRDVSRGGFDGGGSRGGFRGRGRGRGRGGNFGQVASESVRAVTTPNANEVANAWKAAINSNVFDDEDAAEVKGLDTLGGGNLHRMRMASENVAPVSFQPSTQRDAPPHFVPQARRSPGQPFRSQLTGHNNDPIPLGPTRQFPPGYARTPNTSIPGGSPQHGNNVNRGNRGLQTQARSRPQTATTPALITQQRPPSMPITTAAQIPAQAALPVRPKIRMTEPDASSVVVQDDIKTTSKDHNTLYRGRAYICNEPDPVTASITILVQSDAMDDKKYSLAQWTDYLHMEKCLIACFEVELGVSTAHCLEFESSGAMAKFAEKYKAFLDDRNKKDSSQLLTGPKEEQDLPTPSEAIEAINTSPQITHPEPDKPHAVPSPVDKSKATNSPAMQKPKPAVAAVVNVPTKPQSRDAHLQAAWQKNQAIVYSEWKAQTDAGKPAVPEMHKSAIQISNQSKPQLAIAKENIEDVNITQTNQHEHDPLSKSEQAMTGQVKEAQELTPASPPKEVDMSETNQFLEPPVVDQSDGDEENTLREYLLRLRDNVKDLAKTKGLDSAVDLDEVFRTVVETFVSQTSGYYNQLDKEGKKDVVQAYCDLAMKPKARRRSYSPEQLLDMRDSAQPPSESDMHFVPPSPKTTVSTALSKSTLSGSAATFVPKAHETPQPRPDGNNLSDQIKKAAANAAWLMGSSNPSTAKDSREKEKSDKQTGLSGSRWADSTTTPVANPGRFTGPLRGQDDISSSSLLQPGHADQTIRDRPLIPSLDGSSDMPRPMSGSGTPKCTGAARDLIGLNFNGPFLGNTADLEGLVLKSDDATNMTETSRDNTDAAQNAKHKLTINPKLECKEEPKVISPTSVSSIGGIESAFRQMRLS